MQWCNHTRRNPILFVSFPVLECFLSVSIPIQLSVTATIKSLHLTASLNEKVSQGSECVTIQGRPQGLVTCVTANTGLCRTSGRNVGRSCFWTLWFQLWWTLNCETREKQATGFLKRPPNSSSYWCVKESPNVCSWCLLLSCWTFCLLKAAHRNTLLVQLIPYPHMQRSALLSYMPEQINGLKWPVKGNCLESVWDCNRLDSTWSCNCLETVWHNNCLQLLMAI